MTRRLAQQDEATNRGEKGLKDVRQELQAALELATNLPVAELPRLLGDLREVEAVAMMRLASPAIEAQDELIGVEQAAKRMHVSKPI